MENEIRELMIFRNPTCGLGYSCTARYDTHSKLRIHVSLQLLRNDATLNLAHPPADTVWWCPSFSQLLSISILSDISIVYRRGSCCCSLSLYNHMSDKPSYQDVHGNMDNGPVIDKDGLAVQTTGRSKTIAIVPPIPAPSSGDAVTSTAVRTTRIKKCGMANNTTNNTSSAAPDATDDSLDKKEAEDSVKPLEDQFKDIAEWVRHSAMAPTDDEKLMCYGLFKQATEGDVKGSQPWAIQVTARAKWDAWNKHKGMEKDEAMKKYVDTVALQREKYGF